MDVFIRAVGVGRTLPTTFLRLSLYKNNITKNRMYLRRYSKRYQGRVNDTTLPFCLLAVKRNIHHCQSYSSSGNSFSTRSTTGALTDSEEAFDNKNNVNELHPNSENTSSNTEAAAISDDLKNKNQMENVEETIDRLRQKALNVDVMINSIPVNKFVKDIKHLIDSGFPLSQLDLLCTFPKVFFNLPKLTELIRTLFELGYKRKDIIALFKSRPSLMGYTGDQLVDSFMRLNRIGFGSKSIVKLTSVYPNVLDMSTRVIQGRIAELRELFKTEDVFMLLEKSPHVLRDSMDTILEKFAYVHEEMGITQRQMMYSSLFNLPIEHLHTRHMYLVRTGYFKKVKNAKQISTNPSLDVMIDTTDEEFVERFGGLSVHEYEVFKALLKRDQVVSVEGELSDDESE